MNSNNWDDIPQTTIDLLSSRIHNQINAQYEWVVITDFTKENSKIITVNYSVFHNLNNTVKFITESFYIDGKIYKIIEE